MDSCFICGDVIDIDDDRDVYEDRCYHYECLVEFIDEQENDEK